MIVRLHGLKHRKHYSQLKSSSTAALHAAVVLTVATSGSAEVLPQSTPKAQTSSRSTPVRPRLIHQLRHSDPVETLAFSPDGKFLATAGRNKLVHLWDMAGGKIHRSFAGHTGAVQTVAFSPDGALLASGGMDKIIRLWEVASGKVIGVLPGHAPQVDTLAFSPDGTLLASGGWDNVVSLWNVEAARQGRALARTLKGHKGRVTSVAFAPDGKVVASAGWDNTLRFWNPASGQLLHSLSSHSDWVQSIAFSSDGKLLASAGWDRAVRLWDVAAVLQGRKTEKYVFPEQNAVVSAVRFMPDTALLVSGSWDKRVVLWNVESQSVDQVLSTQRDWVQCLAVAPTGEYLASGGFDGMVRVWRMR